MMTRKFTLVFTIIILMIVGKVTAQPERAAQFEKYIVKEGETPGLIAEKFNIKKKDFLMLNNFPSNVTLKPGEEVLIRSLKEGESFIEEGKTGGQYAARNGRTNEPLNSSDNASESKSAAKSEPTAVTHPKKTSAPAESISTPAPDNKSAPIAAAPAKSTQTGPNGTKYQVAEGGYHTVEKGQTFYRIALIYGLTVDQLKALNNMSNTTIAVGQKLKVK